MPMPCGASDITLAVLTVDLGEDLNCSHKILVIGGKLGASIAHYSQEVFEVNKQTYWQIWWWKAVRLQQIKCA